MGVLVFKKNEIELIEGSAYNDTGGRYCLGCYIINGSKVIIGSVYGLSENTDAQSLPVFTEVSERLKTMCQVNNTRQVILGGDFNLHLDTCTPKGRTCRFVNDMVQEF